MTLDPTEKPSEPYTVLCTNVSNIPYEELQDEIILTSVFFVGIAYIFLSEKKLLLILFVFNKNSKCFVFYEYTV